MGGSGNGTRDQFQPTAVEVPRSCKACKTLGTQGPTAKALCRDEEGPRPKCHFTVNSPQHPSNLVHPRLQLHRPLCPASYLPEGTAENFQELLLPLPPARPRLCTVPWLRHTSPPSHVAHVSLSAGSFGIKTQLLHLKASSFAPTPAALLPVSLQLLHQNPGQERSCSQASQFCRRAASPQMLSPGAAPPQVTTTPFSLKRGRTPRPRSPSLLADAAWSLQVPPRLPGPCDTGPP